MYVHLHACIFENRQTHVGRCSGTFLCYLFLSLMPWSSFFSDQISDRNPIPILQVKGCGSKNTVSCAGSHCVSARSRKDSQVQGLSEGSPRSPATCASGNHAGRGQLLRLTVTEAWIQALLLRLLVTILGKHDPELPAPPLQVRMQSPPSPPPRAVNQEDRVRPCKWEKGRQRLMLFCLNDPGHHCDFYLWDSVCFLGDGRCVWGGRLYCNTGEEFFFC